MKRCSKFGVFLEVDKETGQTVAIKRIRGFADEPSQGTLREIGLLRNLQHPHVIRVMRFVSCGSMLLKLTMILVRFLQMQDVYTHRDSIHLVFDFMETDLATVINDKETELTVGHVKSYMRMLLSGVEYLHQNSVIHRVKMGFSMCTWVTLK